MRVIRSTSLIVPLIASGFDPAVTTGLSLTATLPPAARAYQQRPTSLNASRLPATVAQPRWITVPKIREFKPYVGGLFDDIVSRVGSVKWYGDYGTTAHELTHLLNNEISGGINWAYYVGDGRATLLPPARFVMSDVARVFPETARGPMYEFYVVGIPENELVPMVLLDEWTAYYNDLRVQMQLIHHFSKEQRVSVTEQLAEFCVIGLAVHDAIERHDPAYLGTRPEFTRFIAWLLDQSLAVYDAAAAVERFKWEEKYMTPRVRRYLDARLKLMSR